MLLIAENHSQRSHRSRPRQRRVSGRSAAESLYGWRSGEYGKCRSYPTLNPCDSSTPIDGGLTFSFNSGCESAVALVTSRLSS